jgi:hypothetical protein
VSRDSIIGNESPTLSFAQFWSWLIRHPNCILRAGTQDAVVYDDEDFHWHFAVESPDTPLVQIIRGKRLIGELLIARERIAYVQGTTGDVEGEHVFDLVVESEIDQLTAYFFVLSHAYDETVAPAEEFGAGGSVH